MTTRTDATDREARRDRWMKIAVAASVTSAVACTLMLGVTVSLLRRGHEVEASVTAPPAPPSPATPPQRFVAQRPAASPSPTPSGADPALAREGRSPAPVKLGTTRRSTPVSPAVAALAGKLHLVPAALARVTDESGEVPGTAAARLERASDAGKALGARLGLDATNTQVFGNLFLDEALAGMEEERRSGGAPDAARIEEIRQDTIAGVRAVAGEQAIAEAERALDELR